MDLKSHPRRLGELIAPQRIFSSGALTLRYNTQTDLLESNQFKSLVVSILFMSSETGLTEVSVLQRGFKRNEERNFDKGSVRKALQRVFSPEKDYVLFQTIANEEAATALRNYIGFRDDFSSPWHVREIQEGDDPLYVPGANNKGNGLMFDNSLMDSYQRAIDKLANEMLGRENFSHYHMVATSGVHNHDRDPNAIFWPRVYIVDAEKEEILKEIIDNLSGDKYFEVLKEMEAPSSYQMGEIETLYKLEINPIVRLPQEIRIGAQDLSAYVDFLAQMTDTYEWTGPVVDAEADYF